jgi:Zn-dependent protease
VPSDGYYDEEGYWHRDPDPRERRGRRPVQQPPPRRRHQPIRDPYYEQYQGVEYDPYGRPVRTRRVVVRRPYSRRPVTSELGMFSNEEIKDLVIATLVLAVAFTMALGHHYLFSEPLVMFIVYFPISLIATATAFTAHEVGHKFMAQKYGFPAEFVINHMGILVALGTAFLFGVLFALPGAVVFSGAGADKRLVGHVGAAGPAINIVLALAFVPLMIFVWAPLYIVVIINIFLAGFNMIPFGPFDGLKVWRWNPGIYIGMMAIIVVIAVMVLLDPFGLIWLP